MQFAGMRHNGQRCVIDVKRVEEFVTLQIIPDGWNAKDCPVLVLPPAVTPLFLDEMTRNSLDIAILLEKRYAGLTQTKGN